MYSRAGASGRDNRARSDVEDPAGLRNEPRGLGETAVDQSSRSRERAQPAASPDAAIVVGCEVGQACR